MKNKSKYVEFQQHSIDFLKLLGEKARQAERSKTAAEELSTMEFFWDGVDSIFQKYEMALHELRLQCATEHAKAVILRKELMETYNEVYRVRHKIPDTILKIVSKTNILSKEQFEDHFSQQVNVNNPAANGKEGRPQGG